MTSQPTTPAATPTRPFNLTSYGGFGAILKDWLQRADRSQKELAHVLSVNPSTVTHWMQGQKRPDSRSLVKLLATFKGWFRGNWDPLEALDALACLEYDWSKLEEVSVRHFQKGGDIEHVQTWWQATRPVQRRLFLPPQPVIHVPRAVERDLIAALTTLSGYRRARWRAVILYGLAGIGKTALAQALADDEQVKRAFRDGIAWVDGSRDPEEEVTRLCLGFRLEREPGERWVECWRRWAGAAERRLLLIVDDALDTEALPLFIAGLGPQVVFLITTQQGAEIRAEVERWLPAEAITEAGIHGLRPDEGKQLVESVVTRLLSDPEGELVQEIGERVGWHPEALRLAAIEGREIGWEGPLGELRAGRMPWDGVRRLVMRQWARLGADRQAWLAALIDGQAPDAVFTAAEAARRWQVETAVVSRRLWILKGCGLVTEESSEALDSPQWRVEPIAHRVLTENV